MTAVAGDAVAGAEEALARGDWDDARQAFEDLAAAGDPPPLPVLDGLAEARWWLGDVDGAIAAREAAYGQVRAAGRDAEAVWFALWLAREFDQAVGNDAGARGWLARADTLLTGLDDPGPHAWAALTRATRSPIPDDRRTQGEAALAGARQAGDVDLEVLALAQVGLALAEIGDLDRGLACFEEAMAIATGEGARLRTVGELCCQMTQAAELAGDMERFGQWNDVIQRFAFQHRYPPLVAFCATCCSMAFSSQGQWETAEQELRNALEALQETGHRSRCLPPAARLAELCILRGRFEEAEALLGDDDSDETLLSRAQLALARDQPDVAIRACERFVRRNGGDTLLTTAALVLQADAHRAADDRDAATAVADRLDAVATDTGDRRTAGRAALVRGLLAADRGDASVAAERLETALDLLSGAPGSIDVCRAHLALATTVADTRPDLARSEARAALAGFEAAGAARLADEAAALLRTLGDRSRVGAKGGGTLTDREQEVLRLVANGLTNAEIAERLYISPKTAGNHVSNILTKLGVRSRTEAASLALQNGLIGRS